MAERWRRHRGRGPVVPRPSPGASPSGSLAERLTRLGEQRRSGVLQVPGPRGGEIFVDDGRITLAESLLTPGPEVQFLHADLDAAPDLDPRHDIKTIRSIARSELERRMAEGSVPRPHLEFVVASATADAVTLLWPPDGVRATTSFRAGRTHWLGDVRPVRIGVLLGEVERRRAVLAEVAPWVSPDRVLRRAEELPLRRVRLSAAQWDLIRVVDGTTPLSRLAWAVGRGVFTTTLTALGLVRLGVLVPVDGDLLPAGPSTGPERPGALFLRTRSAPGQ